MGPEEFRAAGHELIDWIADYRARIPQLQVQHPRYFIGAEPTERSDVAALWDVMKQAVESN
jgi:hypothetical protein